MKMKKILIAIDDSKFSENAAGYGFDLARLYEAHVGLVIVVEPIVFQQTGADAIMGTPFEANAVNDAELIKAQTESAENTIEKTIKRLGEGLQITQFTEFGSTAEGILECSKQFNADLVVLGTHSRTGLDRLLMGNVAEHVVRHSEVPVLVVPLKGE
jgi:nucleotide-binding universal stress UspA family protein